MFHRLLGIKHVFATLILPFCLAIARLPANRGARFRKTVNLVKEKVGQVFQVVLEMVASTSIFFFVGLLELCHCLSMHVMLITQVTKAQLLIRKITTGTP